MSEAVADLDRRVSNMLRVGVVKSVDANAAVAVVDFGDLKSPPLPVGQLRAGAMQFWWMPTVGEQVLVTCPNGDIAQGMIAFSIFAGNAPSGDADVPQINLSGGRMVVSGSLEITGDLNIGGTATAQGDVIASGISLKSHTHPETGVKTEGPE